MTNSYEEWRSERVYHHIYETCEGIQEHAERIADLEALIFDMWGALVSLDGGTKVKELPDLAKRMIKLDILPEGKPFKGVGNGN